MDVREHFRFYLRSQLRAVNLVVLGIHPPLLIIHTLIFNELERMLDDNITWPRVSQRVDDHISVTTFICPLLWNFCREMGMTFTQLLMGGDFFLLTYSLILILTSVLD